MPPPLKCRPRVPRPKTTLLRHCWEVEQQDYRHFRYQCRQITNYNITLFEICYLEVATGRHADHAIRAWSMVTQPASHNYHNTRRTFLQIFCCSTIFKMLIISKSTINFWCLFNFLQAFLCIMRFWFCWTWEKGQWNAWVLLHRHSGVDNALVIGDVI